MPDGAVGEAGATARSLIGSLGEQPLVLALVVLCGGLIGLLYWSANIASHERSSERQLMYDSKREIGQLLARCNIQPSP